MALAKTFERPDGSTLSYWKILSFDQGTWRDTIVRITLGGFVDASTRAKNKEAGEIRHYTFDMLTLLGNYAREVDAEPVMILKPIKAMYLGLLATGEWFDAVEC